MLLSIDCFISWGYMGEWENPKLESLIEDEFITAMLH